ncbi:MAG TPA: carbohydrate ABC transporter permease, partial [Anaerolineae bacterium]|nr:carbohydrate ABC transporter permease [Anaerolineae bacterium]
MRSPKTFFTRFGIYAVLLLAMVMSLFPIVLVIMNSLKTRKAIFSAPWMPPTPDTFSLGGYETVLARSNFGHYFVNSLTVTLTSMFLILLLGAMAAFALSEYSFRGDALLGLYLAIGIMIPIRLGTVSILRLVVALHLVNTLVALILVYTAMGLPLAIFILTQF